MVAVVQQLPGRPAGHAGSDPPADRRGDRPVLDRASVLPRCWRRRDAPVVAVRSQLEPPSSAGSSARRRLFQFGGVEALSEPTVDGSEGLAGLGGFALGLPRTGEVGCPDQPRLSSYGYE